MGSFAVELRHRIYGSTLGVLILIGLGMVVFGAYSKKSLPERDVNPRGLLDVIAHGESRGNYNAYYGSVQNKSIDFTKMTLKEVLAWQADYVKSGSPSSAVGKYQFIRPTLDGLLKERGIDENAYFDEQLQDELAVALLERRGLNDYIEGKIDRDQFAHHLSKEWAALPKIIGEESDKSYYEGDGLNHARTSVEEVYGGIENLEKKGKESLAKNPKD